MQLKLNDLTLIIKFDDDKEKKLIKKFITFKDDKSAFFGGKFHPEAVKEVCLGKDIREYFVCFAGLTKEIILFAKQPFTSNLIMSNINEYRENIVWLKNKSGNGFGRIEVS